MVLEDGRFFLACSFYPTQSPQCREVHDKAVEAAALSLVGHEVKISLGQLLYILWIDTSRLVPGHPLLCSCCPVERRGSHQCYLVVMEDIGLVRTNFGVD
jgi:hypothetical protein